MMIAQRPTWRRTATCRPTVGALLVALVAIVGALLVALVAYGTPTATTPASVGDAPGALAPTAISYQVGAAAAPSFATSGDDILERAPSMPVVLGPVRDVAVPAFATSGDDILERAPSAPTTPARECVTPSTCTER